jgi:hypothetical protein
VSETPAPAEAPGPSAARPRPRIGTALGIVLFTLTLIGLVILAAAGFEPALYLLITAVVGVLMIAIGARMH